MNDFDLKNLIRIWWDNSSTTSDTSGHQITTIEENDVWIQEFQENLPSPPLTILDVG